MATLLTDKEDLLAKVKKFHKTFECDLGAGCVTSISHVPETKLHNLMLNCFGCELAKRGTAPETQLQLHPTCCTKSLHLLCVPNSQMRLPFLSTTIDNTVAGCCCIANSLCAGCVTGVSHVPEIQFQLHHLLHYCLC